MAVSYFILLIFVHRTTSDENLKAVVDLGEESKPRFLRQVEELPKSQDSRSFGYSIEDEQQSSHFRKEQRDLNGVVRGSYGLKDPNGSYRLVRYIADDKGFRAHVSSNEHGVGRQNPASVRLSRFQDTEFATKDTNPPDALFSTPSHQKDQFLDDKDIPGSYNFYTPVSYSFKKDESPNTAEVANPILSNQFIDHMSKVKERLPAGTSGSFTWPQYNYGVPNHGNDYFGRRPSSFQGGEGYDSRSGSSRGGTNGFPSYTTNGAPGKVFSSGFDERNTNYPPNVLKLMLRQPPLKVHTSLPDCGSVNSGVLCKPPLVYASNYLLYNASENGSPVDKASSVAYRRERIETTLAERLYRFATTNDEVYPSHTLPSDFGLRDDIRKAFPGLRSFHQQKSPCDRKSNQVNERPGDLSETSSLPKPVIYNTISNTQISSMMKYNDDWNKPLTNPMRSNYESLNNRETPQQVSYSQNSETIKPNSFDANDKFILLTSQNEKLRPEQSLFNLFKNLNVLGFIILPQDASSQGVKDIVENQLKLTTQAESSTESHELNSTPKRDDVKQVVPIDESTTGASPLSEETKPVVPDTSKSPTEDIDSPGSTETTLEAHINSNMQLNNSRFLILDETSDVQIPQKDNNTGKNSDMQESEPHDWRKLFEKELESSLENSPMANPVKLPDESINSNLTKSTGIPNERVYSINEPQVPLYDSKGNPIKSENVPLHLHRYVPPAAIGSFPWKFAIPRPAPPRSIALPPKPPVLS